MKCIPFSIAALLIAVHCLAETPHPLFFGAPGDDFSGWIDGRIHLDAAHYFEGKNRLDSGTDLRRVRLGVHAILYRYWEAEIDINLAGDEVDVDDTWIAYRNKTKNIKFGAFKEPFGLERLTSSRYLLFAERSMASEALAPGRKIGLQISQAGTHWYVAAGLFGQEGDETASGDDEAVALTGRFVYRPIDETERRLHLGLALTHRTPNATASGSHQVRFRTFPETRVSNRRYLNTGRISQVDYTESIGFEGGLTTGPLSLQGEYLYTAVRRGAGYSDLAVGGGYVAGAWILHGGRRGYLATEGEFGPVVTSSHDGAWELALRYSTLDLSDFAGPVMGGTTRHATLGLNWYANPLIGALFNITLVDNDEFAYGGSPSGSLVGDDDYSFIHLRLQTHF